MKIASKIGPIKTRKNRRVTVHGQLYVFEPTQDNSGATHFVAEVNNEQHVDTLLDSGHYYAFSKDMQKKAALSKPSGSTEGGAGGGEKKSGGAEKPAGFTDEVIADATELLKGTIQEVAKAVGKKEIVVVQCALQLEKGVEQPRAGMVKLLEQTVEMAIQAGVIKA